MFKSYAEYIFKNKFLKWFLTLQNILHWSQNHSYIGKGLKFWEADSSFKYSS